MWCSRDGWRILASQSSSFTLKEKSSLESLMNVIGCREKTRSLISRGRERHRKNWRKAEPYGFRSKRGLRRPYLLGNVRSSQAGTIRTRGTSLDTCGKKASQGLSEARFGSSLLVIEERLRETCSISWLREVPNLSFY